MRFGPVPLAEAEGAILAHRVDTAGGPLAKGSLLDAAAVARLAGAGLAEVIVARLDPGEIGEDAAAAQLAAALAPDPDALGLRLTAAATGLRPWRHCPASFRHSRRAAIVSCRYRRWPA